MLSPSFPSRSLLPFLTLSILLCSVYAQGTAHDGQNAQQKHELLEVVSELAVSLSAPVVSRPPVTTTGTAPTPDASNLPVAAAVNTTGPEVANLPMTASHNISAPDASNPLVRARERVCAPVEPGPPANEIPPVKGIPPVRVGRMAQVMHAKSGQLVLMHMQPGVTIENPSVIQSAKEHVKEDYAFLVIRKYQLRQGGEPPTFRIALMNDLMVEICEKIIGTRPGISWRHSLVELDPDILLSHYDDFVQYRDELKNSLRTSDDEGSRIRVRHLDQLIATLEEDFAATLASLKDLRKNGEITFNYLKYILKPRQLMYQTCSVTGLPRLCELRSFHLKTPNTKYEGATPTYELTCEAVALINVERRGEHRQQIGPSLRPTLVDRIELTLRIPFVEGVFRVDSMPAYPFEYHPQRSQLEEVILARGKKWASLVDTDWKHMQYEGVGTYRANYNGAVKKRHISGRIVLDGASYFKHNMNGHWPKRVPGFSEREAKKARDTVNFTEGSTQQVMRAGRDHSPFLWDLTTIDLLTAPALVHGYSLVHKQWLKLNVEDVFEIEWNNDAFPNLVLPPARKELLLSLIEAHRKETGMEDFVRGKGQGLIVHLYGPPGVGKTLSAEATSEHVRRPLVAIGSGDLGTNAVTLDEKLQQIFELSTTWNAIVLIDEADVFMERRSLQELERNAMVAVFLRHIEYYRGILFLTTNRVQTFDDAFHSRIHVGLHYGDLDRVSRAKIWKAFVKKLGLSLEITEQQIQDLAASPINGRQIKNAARTAQSLALGRGEKLKYEHLVETLQAMVDFHSRR